MIYHGRVKNGVVVIDSPVPLPEDAEVEVALKVPPVPAEPHSTAIGTWAEVFADVIGKAEGLPSDASHNHDHYLYGTPKR